MLYYCLQLLRSSKTPIRLYDPNLKTDYSKIKLLLTVDKNLKPTGNGNYSVLKRVLEDRQISCLLSEGFRIDEIPDKANFISLLYYLGLLTIAGYERGKYVLRIPNLGMQYLYWEYFREGLRDFEGVEWDILKVQSGVDKLAYEGKLAEFEQEVIQPIFKYLSHRDWQGFNERSLQCIWLTFLSVLPVYRPISEEDLGVEIGYSDLILVPETEEVRYGYVIELKYVKKTAGKREVDKAYQEAEAQIKRYLASDKLKSLMQDKLIKAGIFVYKGFEVAKSNL